MLQFSAISGSLTSTCFSLLKKCNCCGLTTAVQPPRYFGLVVISVFFVLVMGGNVVLAMVAQDLSFIDSLYMMVVLVTTVGYGDIVVEYTQSVWHLVLFAFYGGIPLVILAGILSQVLDIVTESYAVETHI